MNDEILEQEYYEQMFELLGDRDEAEALTLVAKDAGIFWIEDDR